MLVIKQVPGVSMQKVVWFGMSIHFTGVRSGAHKQMVNYNGIVHSSLPKPIVIVACVLLLGEKHREEDWRYARYEQICWKRGSHGMLDPD